LFQICNIFASTSGAKEAGRFGFATGGSDKIVRRFSFAAPRPGLQVCLCYPVGLRGCSSARRHSGQQC
jgi:hypothetical protein